MYDQIEAIRSICEKYNSPHYRDHHDGFLYEVIAVLGMERNRPEEATAMELACAFPGQGEDGMATMHYMMGQCMVPAANLVVHGVYIPDETEEKRQNRVVEIAFSLARKALAKADTVFSSNQKYTKQ